MGKEDEKRNRSSSSSRTMESLSLEINKYPRDLLQRFMSNDSQQLKTSEGEEDNTEEIELNLGLSLGGRFGVDKTSKKLTRSSSIAGSIPLVRDHDAFNTQPAVSYPLLIRTSSLPTETEEEWRKRKEMQTLRRMEAKRRRSEKQKNLNLNRGELSLEDERKGLNANRGNWVAPTWSRNVNRGNTLQGLIGQQQGSQGSVESQGGSSSGISEMERTSSGGEARSPASNQSLQDRINQEAVGSSRSKTNENINRTSSMENPSRKLESAEIRGREIGMNPMEDMPCVFTIGDGPNGRKVEGILYKYGKGEEVRIMCVCHGSFLSPAEFVKHAGGRDVDHPLRHIVVNTSGSIL
ncbi:ninja-family protein AFP2 isoform X2 [Ricinus communis]|uniref:ninja-family protein AFP2 isoform X2 n=1 Tax=Ricinus communis TaxID=3988 RepID=UPI000772A80A|nr:ninja-family protein AFP2 isoform X2 [Ricinus communis]|eukprot:XP_015584566.1 ninja-family protein AFP2 isoform X2 [Ricinus communis]